MEQQKEKMMKIDKGLEVDDRDKLPNEKGKSEKFSVKSETEPGQESEDVQFLD